MNPLLAKLQPYPFERLKNLFSGLTPNPALKPISLGIGEPKHPTPAFIKQALTDALDATGRFEDVGNAADMARPDIILTGDIRSFHEDRGVSPAEAVVELHVAARIAQTKALVWSGLATARVPLTSGGAEGLRAAMEAAVTQAATEIATNTAAKAGV